MKINKILLVSIFLLTIFAIGAVSASDNVNGTDEAVLSDDGDIQNLQDDDDEYTTVVIDIPNGDFEIGEDDAIDIGYPIGTTGTLSMKINGNDAGLKYDKEDFNIYAYLDGTGSKSLVLPVAGDDKDENEYSISLDKLPPATYNVEVTFKVGSDTYSKSATIKLNPAGYVDDDIDVDFEDTYIYGNSANRITVTGPADKVNSVVIKINGAKHSLSKRSDTEYYIDISEFAVGEYELAIFYGDKNSTVEFEVEYAIEYPETIICGDTYYVSLTLGKNANGNLTVKIGDNVIGNKKLENGKAIIQIPDLDIDDFRFRAFYTGKDFDVEVVDEIIDVIPKVIVPSVMTVGENKYLTIYTGNSRGTLYIETDFDEYGPYAIVDVKSSTTSVSLANLDDGEITMNVIFEDNEKTRLLDVDYHIQVKSVPVRIVGTRDIKMTYNDGTVYKFTVYGSNSRPADEEDFIEIYIGKEDCDVDFSKNGVVNFKIPNSIAPGKYKIKIIYDDITFENTITIAHLVKLSNAKVKKSADKLVLKATLKKGMKNKRITFKFKNVKKSVLTNSKGVAKVTIPSKVLKKLKVGKKVTYSATYLKDTVKKTVKVQK